MLMKCKTVPERIANLVCAPALLWQLGFSLKLCFCNYWIASLKA